MAGKIRVWVGVTTAFCAAWSATAAAQEPLPPLPPPPPPTAAPPAPPPPPPSPPVQTQPQPPDYAPRPPPGYYYVPPPSADGAPPPIVYYGPPPPPSRVHAPRNSLWIGGRLALFGFGGSFFANNAAFSQEETTGNFVKSGPELAIDVGARLARRYIPYVTLEIAGLPAGHRFAGDSNVHASSGFFGVGFRYIGGDVNTVGFLTDLSFGARSVDISNDATGENYRMTAFEIFRLGLGAEIRVRTHLTIEPIFSIGGGSMSGTSGSITYSTQGMGDGQTHPTYEHGQTIGTQTSYYTVSLGVGVHFDLFGH
jgi:hypothetical protein